MDGLILPPQKSRLPCRLQDLLPCVGFELLQEFQERIEMSIAENKIIGNPDPPLGLIMGRMQTSGTPPVVRATTPDPTHAAPTRAPHVGDSQAGQEGLDLQGHLVDLTNTAAF